MKHLCSICLDPARPGWVTCGRSECQEAAYHLNRLNMLRKGSRARAEAVRAHGDAFDRALHVSGRRNTGGIHLGPGDFENHP